MDTGESVVKTLIESNKEKAAVQMSYDISAAEIMWESLSFEAEPNMVRD